jgi:hypothetical protein
MPPKVRGKRAAGKAARHQMQEHTSLICARRLMSTVELLVVLSFLLVAVGVLALYLVERRLRKGPWWGP